MKRHIKTLKTGKVTFTAARKRLWTKGEESGNFDLVSILTDCDNDTLLIKVNPTVLFVIRAPIPAGQNLIREIFLLDYLQSLSNSVLKKCEGSYTTSLFQKGVNRMAQKLGEEAVETVIEATNGTDEMFLYEASDLLYHLIVLLTSKGYSLDDLGKELKKRHK